LNITLLPVTKNVPLPSEFGGGAQVTRLAEQLLDSYDYARAKVILDGLGQDVRSSGPFLVAVRPQGTTQRLFVDMSHVVPDLVWDWTRTFCWLAAQERTWSEEALTRLALNSRNAFALAAEKYGDVLLSIGLLPGARP
jgi:Zn-dependent protease with chaperone function